MNIEEAKRLVAGPFGEQLTRLPLRFCKPAFFGTRPQVGATAEINNGTATLIARNGEYFAMTCQHVISEYRRKRETSQQIVFNIGNCEIDPIESLASESAALDVAVIRLSETQAAEITHDSHGIGEAFFQIPEQRPELVPETRGIAFAGFPGELRRVERFDTLNFGGYACGATPVTSSRDTYLICQFDRQEWVRQGFEPEPTTIRGISGGPVFEIRESEVGIISHNFAGIVYQCSEEFDLLYITQARAIHDLMEW